MKVVVRILLLLSGFYFTSKVLQSDLMFISAILKVGCNFTGSIAGIAPPPFLSQVHPPSVGFHHSTHHYPVKGASMLLGIDMLFLQIK